QGIGDVPGPASVLGLLKCVLVAEKGLGASPIGSYRHHPTTIGAQPLAKAHRQLSLARSGQAGEDDEGLGCQAYDKSGDHLIVAGTEADVAVPEGCCELSANGFQVQNRAGQAGSGALGKSRQIRIGLFHHSRSPVSLFAYPPGPRFIPVDGDHMTAALVRAVPCIARLFNPPYGQDRGGALGGYDLVSTLQGAEKPKLLGHSLALPFRVILLAQVPTDGVGYLFGRIKLPQIAYLPPADGGEAFLYILLPPG